MKKFGFLFFIVALVGGIAAANFFSFGSNIIPSPSSIIFGKKVNGSGNVAIKTAEVGSFSGIRASGIFRVYVEKSEKTSVKIKAEDNILPLVSAEVNDGVLRLRTNGRFDETKGIKVYITAPDVNYFRTSGVAQIVYKNAVSDRMRIRTSGASKIVLSGKTDRLDVKMSGASNIDTSELDAKIGSVRSSGASYFKGSFVETLKVRASGASQVRYKGAPEISKRISGGSSISKF